mmetsp:Transcript_12543/g.31594  ORF Transcript_12543/g.31594 Transcript_12543/m.31594 type:complete len:514 (+) Transcript_12543:56-1597(+)
MQYFGCCPNPEGSDTIETTLTTQEFSTRSALNASPGNYGYSRSCPIDPPSTNALDGTNRNAPVNPYRVLELRRDATPSEIIGSYRKLALMYHPGRKISCPLERKKRMQTFEVLAACYETLMHSEFRRKCDILLKDTEKKQKNSTNREVANRQPKLLLADALSLTIGSSQLAIKSSDSIPGLVPSQSSSASGEKRNNNSVGGSGESNDTPLRNNCTALGGILTCNGDSRALTESTSINKSFAISRDGTKGYKALADASSSLSVSQSGDEGEIHFSEATVNRLFGGPMASLHRARNFQAFSDPYLVFDKVFGNKKPMFPRVALADMPALADDTMEDLLENRNQTGISNSLVRSSTSELAPFSPKNKSNGDDKSANTRVFVSSRIVNGRKITKTETVHVDPATGIASVNVTVDSEYLEPVNSKDDSSGQYGSCVTDWLLCFGMAKVAPSTKKNISLKKSATCCPKNQSNGPHEEKFDSSCNSNLKSLYIEALEDFYMCNHNFHQECNKYMMQCGKL